MVLSVGILAAIDSIVKHAANAGMHPIQIVFFRCLFGLIILLPIFFRSGLSEFKTSKIGLNLIRGVIHSFSMILWFTAITLIPLADATALSFTIPIYASIGAILFLGEPSQRLRWAAIVLGFIGMAIIIRPGLSEINMGSLFVIGSAVLAAISKLILKSLAETDKPTSIVFFMTLTITVVSFIPSLFLWKTPPIDVWLLLILLGVGGTLAHTIQTYAYSLGEITALEPFSFCRLIWAAAFGFFIFSELPTVWTWLGTCIILVGAILLARFEKAKENIVSITIQ